MARRLQPGDRVVINSKAGKGEGTFVGHCDQSGMPIVRCDKLTVDDGEKRVNLQDVPVYATSKSLRRD